MPIVTKTIGTAARNYSTIQAWEDALPANLVTDGNSQVGECYNDSEFSVAGTVVSFGGETTDSTHTITLKCAAGQSFRDNASVQSNALRYNATNGVGLKNTGTYAAATISNSISNVFLDGLQLVRTGNGGDGVVNIGNSVNGWVISNCIMQNDGTNPQPVLKSGSPYKAINNVIIQKYSNASAAGVNLPRDVATAILVNNTIICPSDVTAAAPGIKTVSAYIFTAPTVTNNAIFGFTSFVDTVGSITGSNNATDLASVGFGTSNQVSKTFTSQFQGTLTASLDLRAKTGADLLNNAVTDTTNIPSATDIATTSRPQGAAWDIGAWELVAAASFLAAWAGGSNLPVIGTGHY